jgi:predicted transcriptional regulator
MDSLEVYERYHTLIHSVYRSRLKVQILLTLLNGEATLAHLREVTGSTSQAVIPKIRGLEGQALLEQSNYQYRLTPLGKVVAANVERFVQLMGGIGRHQQFWATHHLWSLPEEFLASISDLLDAEVKYDTTVDMFSVYSHYIEILKDASYIHGLSSVASPGLAEFLAQKVISGIPVELVVRREVVDLLSQEPYAANMKDLASFPNFLVWVTGEDLKVGLTATDKYLSLGLFKKDTNLYDSSTDLFSNDPQAVSWGERLFQYYKKRSENLDIATLFR